MSIVQSGYKGLEMLTIEEIQDGLKDRRISLVASATGIHRNTITYIRDKGAGANPTYAVLKALSDYLNGNVDLPRA